MQFGLPRTYSRPGRGGAVCEGSSDLPQKKNGSEKIMADENLNITFDLIAHARANPGGVALVLMDREINYEQLNGLTWICAQYLHEQGVRASDIVALTFKSDLLLAIAILGLTRIGATVLSIPKSATASQRSQWEEAAHAKYLLSDCSDEYASNLPRLLVQAANLSGPARIDISILCEEPDSYLTIAVGSGSTGEPKLLPVTHEQMRGRFEVIKKAPVYSPDTRAWEFSSLEFASIQTSFFCVLHLGAAYCFLEPSLAHLVESTAKYNVNRISLSAFHLQSYLRADSLKSAPRLNGIKSLSTGGSTITRSLRDDIRERITDNLYVAYGANECYLISLAGPPSVFAKSGTVGAPVDGVRIEVVDDKGIQVVAGARGNMRLKSPGLISGYLDDAEGSRRVFQDGWFYPGDIVEVGSDGDIIHLGRSDQMMIFNGINIYPAEIEQCLSLHPDVKDVTAFPIQHEIHQELPVCAVALYARANVLADELIGYTRDLIGFRHPRRVFIVDEIPRNYMGKVIRKALFEKISKGQ